MKISNLLPIVFFATLLCSCEQSKVKSKKTFEPRGGLGFYSPDSLGLPAAIKRAAGSIFKIAVPAGKLVNASEFFKSPSLQENIKMLESKPLDENFEAMDRAIYIHQLNECQRLKVENCKIFDGVSLGSSFVTGDGQDLRTALHVIKDFALYARASGGDGRIPIFLSDSNGRLVYGPHNLNAKVVATLEGALDANIYEDADFGKFNLDQVLIRVDQAIAPALSIANKPAQDGEIAFIIGVPRLTTDRKNFALPDGDGHTVKISYGMVLGLDRLKKRLVAAGFNQSELATLKPLTEGLAVAADSAPQVSGGAILNSKGEVLGIYTSGLPKSGEATPHHISYGGNELIRVGN